jgi:uncharacterized membrane protein YhaH (DUF805 family)
MDKLISWRWLLFGFSGRINRAKYWFTMLVYGIIGILVAVIGYFAGDAPAFRAFRFAVNLALWVSGLAVAVKRLHDLDKSAWWAVFFYVFPVVLICIALAAAFAASNGMGELAGAWGFLTRFCILAAVGIGFWFFVELAFFRGTRGYNRYGPDSIPRARPASPSTNLSAGRR